MSARLLCAVGLSLLGLLPACKGHGQGAPPAADAGPIAAPNLLQPCADLRACEEACRGGSAGDCLSAASSYGSGQGAALDEARSAALFASACALGSAPGCNLAGRASEFGRGVPVDLGKALSFYEDACRRDYMGGCYNVAVTVENGRGTARDDARAAALYTRVCEAGSQVACAAAHRLASTP